MYFYRKITFSFRLIALFLSIALSLPAYAVDGVLNLPVVGTMVNLSGKYMPLSFIGLRVNAQDSFKFNFIVDSGDSSVSKEETKRLLEYFLGVLAIPRQDLWVNLSPYEKNRIIPNTLGETALGHDLLAQDYVLKQLAASLTYPETKEGKAYWDTMSLKSQMSNIRCNEPGSLAKIWVMPGEAEVYRKGNSIFITKARLKVMTESDYLAMQKNFPQAPSLVKRGSPQDGGAEAFKNHILPLIEKEVNTGKNFAPLRQIYSALILATWYKQNLKATLLNRGYSDQGSVSGINNNDKSVNEKIYAQYIESFQKGAYNVLKKERKLNTIVKRKYFSGGFAVEKNFAVTETKDARKVRWPKGKLIDVETAFVRGGKEQKRQNERISGSLKRIEHVLYDGGYGVYQDSNGHFDFMATVEQAGGNIHVANTILRIVDKPIGNYGNFRILQIISPWVKGGHAGRGSKGLATYAATQAEAVHEMNELTSWIKYVLDMHIATVDDVHLGVMGEKLRAWASNDVKRQNLLIAKYFQFHYEAIVAQYRGVDSPSAQQAIREARLLADDPPRLKVALKDFDVAIAADGLMASARRAVAVLGLITASMACTPLYFPQDKVSAQAEMEFWDWMQKYRQEDLAYGDIDLDFLRKVMANRRFIAATQGESNIGKLSLAREVLASLGAIARVRSDSAIDEALRLSLANHAALVNKPLIKKNSSVLILAHEGFMKSAELMRGVAERIGAKANIVRSDSSSDGKRSFLLSLQDIPFNQNKNVLFIYGHGYASTNLITPDGIMHTRDGDEITLTRDSDESRDNPNTVHGEDTLWSSELAYNLISRARKIKEDEYYKRLDDMVIFLPPCLSADFASHVISALQRAYQFGEIRSFPTIVASANRGTYATSISMGVRFLGIETEAMDVLTETISVQVREGDVLDFAKLKGIEKLVGLYSDMVVFTPPANEKIVEMVKAFTKDWIVNPDKMAKAFIFADMIGNKADVTVEKRGDKYAAKVIALAKDGGGALGELNFMPMENAEDELDNVGRLLSQSGLSENDPVARFFDRLLSQAPELYTYNEHIRDIFGLSPKEHNIAALYSGMMRLPAPQRAIALWHELNHNANNRGLFDFAVAERDGAIFLEIYSGPVGVGAYRGEIELTEEMAKTFVQQAKSDAGNRFHYLLRALQRQLWPKDDAELTEQIKAMQDADKWNGLVTAYDGDSSIERRVILDSMENKLPGLVRRDLAPDTSGKKASGTYGDVYTVPGADDLAVKVAHYVDGFNSPAESQDNSNQVMAMEQKNLYELNKAGYGVGDGIPQIEIAGVNSDDFMFYGMRGIAAPVGLDNYDFWDGLEPRLRLLAAINTAKALRVPNKLGKFHGDVSLKNIMINREGKVMLIDWSHMEGFGKEALVNDDWRAPEDKYNDRSEVFSWGMIFNERLLDGGFIAEGVYPDGMARELRGIIKEAMQKDGVTLNGKIISSDEDIEASHQSAAKKRPSFDELIERLEVVYNKYYPLAGAADNGTTGGVDLREEFKLSVSGEIQPALDISSPGGQGIEEITSLSPVILKFQPVDDLNTFLE